MKCWLIIVSFAESITKTLPKEKVEDNKESKSEELEVQKDGEKVAVDAAAEPKASDSEQTEDVKAEFDASDAPEQLKPEAETQPENTE